MVERINENLIIMNLRMVYYENLHEVMLRWMPDLKQVRSYCRVWAYDPMLPPNHKDPLLWKEISCVKRDLTLEQLEKAEDLAIAECDPTIPTICLIEEVTKFSKEQSRDEYEEETLVSTEISQASKALMEEVD